MASLWTGNHYLIQDFAVATSPSLRLIDPRPLTTTNLQILSAGFASGECDASGCPYYPINGVKSELENIIELFPRSPDPLSEINEISQEEFSIKSLAEALEDKRYPILHIATHGQFRADPDNTFIITGKGEKLTIGALDKLIRKNSSDTSPIELIALTACQTGIGGNRSELGLAGVSIRAGARSAIASLWLIPDRQTATIMKNFYIHLKDGDSKAQALQKAQITAIESRPRNSPKQWAGLMLVGNWL